MISLTVLHTSGHEESSLSFAKGMLDYLPLAKVAAFMSN